MKILVGALAGLAVAVTASSASAGYLVGTGNAQNAAAVAGGTVVDFEGLPFGSSASYTVGDLTITGVGGSDLLQVSNEYAGDYNGRDSRYIDNNAGNTHQIIFDFASAVGAFTFNWGAADVIWTLEVYSGLTLIDTVDVAPVFGSNAGDYVGYSAAGITKAVMTTTDPGSFDWVFVDNVSTGNGAVVPEPGTWALMILGFGAVGATLRRRRVAVAA